MRQTRDVAGRPRCAPRGYSPDGRWIVFRLEAQGRFGLFKMRPDGTHIRAILGLSDFAPRFIDWGPRARHR